MKPTGGLILDVSCKLILTCIYSSPSSYMFKKCLSCLQVTACFDDVRPRTELSVGFYTGKVHQINEDAVLLGLFSSVTTEQELVYMLSGSVCPKAKRGDVVYVLKQEESEVVTVPAAIDRDEIQCQVVSLSSSYAVLKDEQTGEMYVFPYVNFHLKDPLKFISKPAFLTRMNGQDMYDVVLEEDKSQLVTVNSRMNLSESAGSKEHNKSRRGSLRPASIPLQSTGKQPTKFASLEDNVIFQRVESEPALDTGHHNLSFSNPFVIKEEDQSSSFITFEGDSGGELIISSGLEAPEPAHGEFAGIQGSTRTSAPQFTRVLMSPYAVGETGRKTNRAEPVFVGKDRLPLYLLKRPGIHDKLIETIGDRAAAWRTCDPASGSFFRAVAVAWLEHLARVTTSVLELEELLHSMRTGEPIGFKERPGFHDFCQTAIETVESIRGLKDFNRLTAIVHLQGIFQQTDTITHLERYMRMMTANYITVLSSAPDLSPSILQTMREQASQLETSGMDFTGVVYTAITETLKVSLSIVGVEEGVVNTEEFHPDEMENPPAEVSLLRLGEHFHILYSREDQAVDGYDLDSHCFEVLEVSGDQTSASFQI